METKYSYLKLCDPGRLTLEINESEITISLDRIETFSNPSKTDIWFKNELSQDENDLLDNIVNNHNSLPLEDLDKRQVIMTDGNGNIIDQIDTDKALIVRNKAAKKGWTYSLTPIEFTTSKLDSLYSKKIDNSNRSGLTYKIYDINDDEITTANNEVNAVKTIFDFEPTFDYELIGGQLQQKTQPNTNIRLWVIGVPDIPENMGGSKEMIGGVNLKFVDPSDKIEADGRVCKYMAYNATYHTNKLRFVLKHDAGVQHDVMILLEIFKA